MSIGSELKKIKDDVLGTASKFESDLKTAATAWSAAGKALVAQAAAQAEAEAASLKTDVGALVSTLDTAFAAVEAKVKASATEVEALISAVTALQTYVATKADTVSAIARRG